MIKLKLSSTKSIISLIFICLVLVSSCVAQSREYKVNDLSKEREEVAENEGFSWSSHQEDHSIYSARALMSSENVVDESEQPGSSKDPNKLDDEYGVLETTDHAEKEWQLMFRYFDLRFDGLAGSTPIQEVSKHMNLLDKLVKRVEPECARDINFSRESFRKHKLWAMRMLDSFGKVPSGVTYGRFTSQGDFEECIGVNVDETIHKKAPSGNAFTEEHYKFGGKYCLLDFRLPLPERPRDRILSIHEPVLDLNKTRIGKAYPILANYSGYTSVFYEAGYMHAFCMPSSCKIEDIMKVVSDELEGLYISVHNVIDCQTGQPEPIRVSQVISIIVLSLILLNAAYASYVYNRRNAPSSKEVKDSKGKENVESDFYSNCFSLQSNFQRLSKPDPRGLTFVHYTRIIAMALTVITHTAAMGTLQAVTKPADASNSEGIFRDFLPQMLTNAFTSIQIFFFMAGFMLVVSTYPAIERDKGHLSFIEYALKRAVRLLPGLFAAIMINFLWPLFVKGPMVNYFTRLIVKTCETNWWRTLGFLSNFDNVEKMCLRHSYFSASDYQLHFVAYPLLLLLYKQPAVALYIAGFLTVAGFAIQVIVILTKLLLPFMMVDYLDKEAFYNVVHYYHHPVWNHMSAFFYGFILGYLVVKQIRYNISPRAVKWTWIVLMPLGIAAIFAPYAWNHYKRPIHRWQMVIYVLVDRSIVLTMCAWLAYASMVLARKPRAKTRPEQPKASNNLPKTFSLDQADKVQDESNNGGSIKIYVSSEDEKKSTPSEKINRTTDETDSRHGETLVEKSIGGHQSDISSVARMGATIASQGRAPNAEGKPSEGEKSKPHLANINILCLVLSRLTFQLYLFNMIVLCIDVQHSKYNWYFSYYFIIVKSAAIYVASAIFATISYITLESPCLCIYITWVKSREAARKKRLEAREKERKVESEVSGGIFDVMGQLSKDPNRSMIKLSSSFSTSISQPDEYQKRVLTLSTSRSAIELNPTEDQQTKI